jgi:hypothetical protein
VDDPAVSRTVSRFEANLLTILQHLLGHTASDAVRLINESRPRPPCLSANAVHLVRDRLAKGCVQFLIRGGGWRVERVLRNGTIAAGRVWERTPLYERTMSFGKQPLEFLIWLSSDNPRKPGVPWRPIVGNLTAADELFFTIALASLESEAEIIPTLVEKAPFAENALARLACPAAFSALDLSPPDFSAWFEPPRTAILECLQHWLAVRWLRSERGKGQTADWTKLGHQGRSEDTVLSAFLGTARRFDRPDLARFILNASSSAFGRSDRTPEYWIGGLEGPGPSRLAERLAIRRAAVAVPRTVGTLADWTRHYRGVGYFDVGYVAAQYWKEEWDAHGGDVLAERAASVVEAVEPLRTNET